MMNLRNSLLLNITQKTNNDFNNMVHQFMDEVHNSASVNDDDDQLRNMKDTTYTKIRNSRRPALNVAMGLPALKFVYSIEVVHNVLSTVGWFQRINQGSTSHKRTHHHVGTMNASTCTPASSMPPPKSPPIGDIENLTNDDITDDDVDNVALKKQEPEQRGPMKIREWEEVFLNAHHKTVLWACSDRYLSKSFAQFVPQYTRWWHLMTNATYLGVKLKDEIKAISKKTTQHCHVPMNATICLYLHTPTADYINLPSNTLNPTLTFTVHNPKCRRVVLSS